MDRNEILSMVRKFNRKREDKQKKMDVQKYVKGQPLMELLSTYESCLYAPSEVEDYDEIRFEIERELHHRISNGLYHIPDSGAMEVMRYIIWGGVLEV